MKRALALGAVLSTLPTFVALGFVRPAQAASPVYDQVSQTALLSGVHTNGLVGASGGLVTVDTGSAYVAAALDSAPSAQVLASPAEPGTLTRTVAGQVNGPAGSNVIDVPDAEARYPGDTKVTYRSADPVEQEPLAFGAAAATAEVGAARAYGQAEAASYAIAGALSTGPSRSTVTLTSAAAAGKVTQDARSEVSNVSVAAGVLTLDGVVATARVRTDGDLHTATQALTITGAKVAGQGVLIGNEGVTAVGQSVVPGQTLQDATKQANAQLAAAGISVHTVGGRTAQDSRSASADTGGVFITLSSPALPGGIPANSLEVVLGGIVLTEVDTVPLPALALPETELPQTTGTVPSSESTTTTTFVPGTPGTPGRPPGLVDQVPPPVLPAGYVLAGRSISAQAALVAFAGWQFLSLGTATLYGFVERRRRQALLGGQA